MEIEKIISNLEDISKNNITLPQYVMYKTDHDNSCEKCYANNLKIFNIDEDEIPLLPIHPNCNCKFVDPNNTKLVHCPA